MDDLLADFLAETREMLEALGGELVSWEDDPSDRARLDAIFRFFHTVKGNCGFFEFPRLEALSHAAEDALADVRADRRRADSALISAVLAIIDRIGDIADAIEAGTDLPDDDDRTLIAALEPQTDASEDLFQPQLATGDDEQQKSAPALRSIRLPVELLDRVMSGVSDMVLARNELSRRLRESSVEAAVEESFDRLSSIIAEVRDAMTRTRMQRIEGLFSALPRLVRDLSAELGKQTMVDIDGSEVELDREMIEIIRNPLTHIIRNAIDHGIEPPAERIAAGKREIGLLSISARQSGNQILIDVVDDGRGIDDARLVEKAIASGIIDATEAKRLSPRERTALIFEPGVSTAPSVTAISGRGVGMDVVRANIERIGGAISVESTPGDGTSVTLRVPLTLTIIPALTVSIGDQRFAIPRTSIEEIVHVVEGSIEVSRLGGAMLAKVRERRLPCLVLADLLGLESDVSDEDRNLVVLRLTGGELFALAVDRLHGHEELVVKPVAPAIIATGLYAGTTLTDDGNPILLLEVTGLARAGGLQLDALERSTRQSEELGTAKAARMTSVLLFTGLDGIRKAMPMAAVERLDEVGLSAVESDGERKLVVIGDRILPLAGSECGPLPEEALRLLRLNDGRSEIGYAIGEAMEIRQVAAELLPADGAADTEGFLLIDGEPTAVLAPYKLFARHAIEPANQAPPVCHLPCSDPWIQNFVRPMVEAAGYRIAEADEPDVDLAIMSEAGTEQPNSARQVIRLRSNPEEDPDGPDSIYRYDHAGLLSALRRTSGRKAL
ncbi:MAG: chemotaxis protein CheA [Novosphingobium sp.]|nr:chemotaxis protein CheA [Novosphingobium sp.]MCP5404022.1 chemotaxis protein CheA [Novosphingobium sp.]